MNGKYAYLLKTAWRDSRKDRGRLLLFMSSIILGIAALVAINSFNDNLVKDINQQAASLLGADMSLSGNREADPTLLTALDSISTEKATELELLSMAYLPQKDESQFVRIKAVEGGFPFYGKLLTEPSSAANNYQDNETALVDESMMIQYGLTVGDSIKLGEKTFEIAASLKNAFGSIGIASSFAPAIYIGGKYMPETNLIQPGSLVNYGYYYKTPENSDTDKWEDNHRQMLRTFSMRLTTVADQKENLSEAFDSLNSFLNLVALVSLLLGCIGVASSVFIYVKNKISSIAIFRCLGMSGKSAFLIYFFQILFLGFFSVLIGAILGSFIQVVLPKIMSDFLPFEVSTSLSWPAILEGISIGLIITILFSLLPLISVRNISPLRTIRASFEKDISQRDPWRWALYFAIVLSIFIFLWRLTGNAMNGLIFSAGLLIAFFLLVVVSNLIMWSVKKFFPRKWSFVARQGLSNLFRPNNQTQTLIISIGLGTAVLTTLFVIRGLLLNNVQEMDAGNQPNIILYGIEKEQTDALTQITNDYEMPIIQQVPIVTMKLDEWKGKSKSEWLQDTSGDVRRWAMNREARVTYRDYLDTNEELVEGDFQNKKTTPGDSILISLDRGYANGLGVEMGDELIWNVQGTRIVTYVGSLRQIEFRNMQARFFIVFPTGVLEQAPQFQVLVTKSPDTKTTASYRNDVVKKFPNVSVVDLGSILASLGTVLDKVSYIIQFMAAFSILTGIIVLISSLFLSKYQRIRESVLLRTLGASRKQIINIQMVEYLILGALSAATGIVISLVGSWFLAKFQLELDFNINYWPILIVFLMVTLLTTFIGMLNSREVVNKSPLEVLRNVG